LREFGIDPSTLVGFTSDGASVMVAAGRQLGVLHQTCLGICCFLGQNNTKGQANIFGVSNLQKI